MLRSRRIAAPAWPRVRIAVRCQIGN